ncbi:channel protein TolC [Leptospira jelokensis]|uniref:Channel protein TolC n=1 Tax=Leptospira jelokensis TaxID=2484931 RepID=A0A4Z0ZU02_9LEPT|nr:channel protein TolC [Leptospira jelokensis]
MRHFLWFLFLIFSFAQLPLEAEGLLLWEDCLWIGLERNVHLKLEKTKSELFPILLKEKWKQYLPKLGVHYFGIFSRNKEQIDQEYRDVRIQIQQMIYDGGETEREKQKIEIKQLIQAEEKKIIREKVFRSISNHYFNANKRLFIDLIFQMRKDRYTLEREKQKTEVASGTIAPKEEKVGRIWEAEFESKRIQAKSQYLLANLELKQSMFLEPDEVFQLEPGFLERIQIYPPISTVTETDENHPLRKKSRLQLELVSLEEKSLENDWKPKFLLGGYVGRNGNSGFPLQNEIYGISFGVQANLGGSSVSSNSQNGTQSEGNGIQRIPGYGPQPVGPGENSYQSGSFGLFDEMGREKKRFDVHLSHEQAYLEKSQNELILKNNSKATEIKLSEAYQKYLLYLDCTKAAISNLKKKRWERNLALISELEYMKMEEEVFLPFEMAIDHYFTYLSYALEMALYLGEDPFSNRYYHLKQEKSNHELVMILKDWSFSNPFKKNQSTEPNLMKPNPFLWEEGYEKR